MSWIKKIEIGIVVILLVSVSFLFFNDSAPKYRTTPDFSKRKWSKEQLEIMEFANEFAKKVGNPSPRRMVSHVLCESYAKNIKDGDIGNGAFKKSYGVMQVKVDTPYYVKSKRPDLINKYVPEMNKMVKEDVLHELRTNPKFNIKMGVLYQTVLIDVCGDFNKASRAYNTGTCKKTSTGEKYMEHIFERENLI